MAAQPPSSPSPRPHAAPAKRLSRAQRVHESTPPERNRSVDLLRALAITVVVIGHWTIIAVTAENGLEPHGVINKAAWTHGLTWIFQVMPVFFLVGGYSNALSWRSIRRKGHTYAGWLRARLRRLGIPLIPLLIVWTAVCGIALAAGADPETVRLASKMALIPTWFLASYLVVIAAAPMYFVLWEKFGWWSIIGGMALACAVDAVSITAGSPLLGYPNYLIVWGTFQQLGFAWAEGRLERPIQRIALIVVGAVGLLLLVGPGPYPVSMLTVEGEAISNSYPTRVTMGFLGLIQTAIVLLAEKPLARLMQRPRLWFAAVLINMRIMSWFLWHLTAMVGVGTLLVALNARTFLPEPLTGTWWATRPLWWLALLAVTAVFVAIFGRFESVPADSRPAPPLWRPAIAAVLVIAGLAVMANDGMVKGDSLAWYLPAMPLAGLLLFGVVNWKGLTRRRQPPA